MNSCECEASVARVAREEPLDQFAFLAADLQAQRPQAVLEHRHRQRLEFRARRQEVRPAQRQARDVVQRPRAAEEEHDS